MWDLVSTCMAQRRVALCIPWQGGTIELVYWYGVLAAVGIFIGAWYASKHIEMEGDDPNSIWDALLWILIPGLLGARLWYVAAEVLGGSTAYSLSRPLDIINPRLGGMNIFGGAIFGLIAITLFARRYKLNLWLMADAALLGLFVGQGIGRFGNFINQELYGPPTNSESYGMLIPEHFRLAEYAFLPPETRFHPTMLYEAAWLFLSFAILAYLFRRYQSKVIVGALSGAYLIFSGVGRFILEVAGLRPDQPMVPGVGLELSFSTVIAMFYVVIGLIIVLDRYGYLKVPFVARPQTLKAREQEFASLVRARERMERQRERDKIREERRKARRSKPAEPASDEELPPQTGEAVDG